MTNTPVVSDDQHTARDRTQPGPMLMANRWSHQAGRRHCESRAVRSRPATLPVVHCASRRQAEVVLAGITERMEEVGLRLHPDKTRIVYCRDGRRRDEHEHTSFTFLGFTFRARGAKNSRDGSVFTSFLPAMSTEALKAKSVELRSLRIHRRTTLSLGDLARWLNPIVSGWMQYYGRFYRSAMYPLLQRINTYLRRWAGRKYRRLRALQRFTRWWDEVLNRAPRLYAQWQWVRGF